MGAPSLTASDSRFETGTIQRMIRGRKSAYAGWDGSDHVKNNLPF